MSQENYINIYRLMFVEVKGKCVKKCQTDKHILDQ